MHLPLAVVVLLWTLTLWFGAVLVGRLSHRLSCGYAQFAIPAVTGALLLTHYLGR